MTSEHIEQLLKIPAIAYLESNSGNLYEYIGNGIFSDINDGFPIYLTIDELKKIPDSFFWFKNEIN